MQKRVSHGETVSVGSSAVIKSRGNKCMDSFLSILPRQDVKNFHDIVQVEESCPRDLFFSVGQMTFSGQT